MIGSREAPVYVFEGIQLDAQHRVLSRASGESIPLTPKAFDTLLYLVERAGELVDKRTLLEAIWPNVIVEDNNLNQCISVVRRALGETRGEHRFIVTEPGRGYRFVAAVETIEQTPGAEPMSSMPALEVAQVTSSQRVARRYALGALSHLQRAWGLRPSGRRLLVSSGAVGIAVALLVSSDYLSWNPWSRAAPIEYEVGQTARLTLERMVELDPVLSPNGRMMAYAAGPLGRTNIFVRQLGGGTVHNLTEQLPGAHRWPRWSPDGTQIAFLVALPRSDDSIQAVPALGGTARVLVQLPELTGHAWSPDGSQIAYTQRWKGVYIQSMRGGEPRLIAEASEPHSPSWSPDGSRIAYVSGNSYFVFGLEAFANIAPSALWVAPARGGAARPVTDNADLNVSPEWTADSRSLFFISDSGGTRDLYQVPVPEPGQAVLAPRRLTTGLNAHTLSRSRDGRSLIYSVFTPKGNIWALPIPVGGAIAPDEASGLTSGNQTIEGIDVSSDGAWLVFDSSRNGNQDIYKMKLDGGEPIRLTDHPSDDFSPSWSRDGKYVAFHSFRNGNRDVFLVSADGGDAEQLTSDPAQERYPDWSPDGNHIVFFSDKTGREELYIVSRANEASGWTAPRQLTFNGGSHAKWSPDGRSIAYLSALRGPNAKPCLISPDGGEPMILVTGHEIAASYPAWSADGRTVYWKARDAHGISSFWSVPASGGELRRLVTLENLSPSGFDRPEFTVDDSRFYFTLSERDSDIWIMDLVELAH